MKNLKKENGAITIIVLVSVLFMVSFLISSYILISNKVKTQKDMIAETRKTYESPLTMEEIYNSYFNNSNIVPIYTVEQLLMMGNENQNININGKYYNFNNDEDIIYMLMNDLKFRAKDYSDYLTNGYWVPIGDNTEIIAKFEGKGHTIEVIYEDDYNNDYSKIYTAENNYSERREQWTETSKPNGWDNDKVKAITDGTNILPLPEGFQVSLKYGENTVDGGLVIRDGVNEFVWIPVTETYTEDGLGPLTDTDSVSNCVYDSQEQLDYYYGEGYFNYSEDFNYAEDKTKIEESINKYDGFYVGRYETTIDEEGNIGSKANTRVLTASTIIREGTNLNDNKPFYYRWYGLYKVQKDMYAGKDSVFSTMITGKQWDKIMSFTGYGDTKRDSNTYTTKPDLSGSAYSTNPNKYDVSKNIYDLAGNVQDWTLKINHSNLRIRRGGYTNGINSASFTHGYAPIYTYGFIR